MFPSNSSPQDWEIPAVKEPEEMKGIEKTRHSKSTWLQLISSHIDGGRQHRVWIVTSPRFSVYRFWLPFFMGFLIMKLSGFSDSYASSLFLFFKFICLDRDQCENFVLIYYMLLLFLRPCFFLMTDWKTVVSDGGICKEKLGRI